MLETTKFKSKYAEVPATTFLNRTEVLLYLHNILLIIFSVHLFDLIVTEPDAI